MKRINIAALIVTPKVIFDQNLDPDLPVRHGNIINDSTLANAKPVDHEERSGRLYLGNRFPLCRVLWENGANYDLWRSDEIQKNDRSILTGRLDFGL